MVKTEFERKKERHASGESTMSADSISGYIPTPPDGGYGWMIVFCAFVIHIFVDGIAFTFGVFYIEFLNYFKESKGKTALVGSLLAGFYLLIAPFASALVNRFGSRSVCIAGGMLASLAFLLSTLAPNLDFLMVTYGVLGGSGLGLAYLPCIVSVSFYFQKRRALATGIAVCGAGVGCFIFAPAGCMLLDRFDWKNAMLIISGAVLNLCVAGAMLRPLEPPRKPTKPRAKNMLDRLMEQAKRGVGRPRADSECSACAYQVKDKVQEVKLAREQALRDEDSESEFGSMPNSAVNSVRRLDSRNNSIIINRMDSMTFKDRPLDIPTIILPPTDKNEYPSDMTTTDPEDNKVVMTIESDSDAGKPRLPIYKPAIKSLNRVRMSNGINGSLPSGVAMCTEHKNGSLLTPSDFAERMQSQSVSLLPAKTKRRRKCPPGVHREDYSRPMYRKDIFYSGSVLHIPEFQSQPNVQGYMKSVTSIPPVMPTMEDDGPGACACIPKSLKDTLKEMMDISLFKDPLFLVPCLGNLFGAIGLFIPYIYISQKAIAIGIDEGDAAFLLSIIGITNTIGRVLTGVLADLPWINSLALHNAALIIGGLSCILNMFCTTYFSLCVFASVFGMCVATWISLTSIILCDLLGLQNLTNAFGLLTMTRGFASIAGPPIAGMIYDLTLDFNASFHVGGLMLTLAGLICCTLHLPYFQRRCTSKLEQVAMDLDIPLPEDSDDGNEADGEEDDALSPV